MTGAAKPHKIRQAEVVEQADAPDSKSGGVSPRAGSIPAFGTNTFKYLAISRPARRRRLANSLVNTFLGELAVQPLCIARHSPVKVLLGRRHVMGIHPLQAVPQDRVAVHFVDAGVEHVRLNIPGTVCPRTGEFFAIEASHCDADVFQVFLDEAAESITPARKRNILILDYSR